jgi:hypothetical protein
MREIGPENFTFEIIEKCNKASLDEREDYWQDYFQAKGQQLRVLSLQYPSHHDLQSELNVVLIARDTQH